MRPRQAKYERIFALKGTILTSYSQRLAIYPTFKIELLQWILFSFKICYNEVLLTLFEGERYFYVS